MQFWKWFILTTAAMVVAKPCKKPVDISTLPECMQQCMRQNTKYFNIERASYKSVCKMNSEAITKFWKWTGKEFYPCMQNQCDGQGQEIWVDWYYDLCGHGL